MPGLAVLDQLKRGSSTRHIPVQLRCLEDERRYCLARGAFSCVTRGAAAQDLKDSFARLRRFADRATRQLLLISDDPAQCQAISELLRHAQLQIATRSHTAALAALHERPFDCAVLDLQADGLALLSQVRNDSRLRDTPIVVLAQRELSAQEEEQLHEPSCPMVVRVVYSRERLLDEATLVMHWALECLPPASRQIIASLYESDAPLRGRKVLLVDDDIRNIFALNSLLERHHMEVISAYNGQEAIEKLESSAGISMVLMDVMMPGMDGYETMRLIRSNASLQRLPIIALTAKAMKEDRERCLEAGASDYVAKPVNSEQLLALVRRWLHR